LPSSHGQGRPEPGGRGWKQAEIAECHLCRAWAWAQTKPTAHGPIEFGGLDGSIGGYGDAGPSDTGKNVPRHPGSDPPPTPTLPSRRAESAGRCSPAGRQAGDSHLPVPVQQGARRRTVRWCPAGYFSPYRTPVFVLSLTLGVGICSSEGSWHQITRLQLS
jgi:hypothetical protein